MATDIQHQEVVDWTDLGREMWSFLTGREAAINYRFVDMAVEVPRDTGAQAPRATWKLNDGYPRRRHRRTLHIQYSEPYLKPVDLGARRPPSASGRRGRNARPVCGHERDAEPARRL